MQKRKLASNLILFLFFILVSIAALFSDIFQNPIKNAADMMEQAKLFTSSDLSQIKRLSLKNKSGEYIFERTENDQAVPWHMVSPRDISANSVFIEKLFNALTVIKVKKLFTDEKINTSNFSIDKPTSTLNLIDQNGRAITISIGLMNTIDNSTYLKIAGRNGIYHVEAPSVSLENITLLDLIESQIISIDLKTLTALKIYKGNKKAPANFEIKKKDGAWIDRENLSLSIDKVDEYFQELSNLKSSFIIEQPTDSQKKRIEALSKNPDYTLSVEDNNGTITDYHVSGMIKEMSDLDLKNEEYFVITTSSAPTTYIVKKEFHELFNKKSDTLKGVSSKN